VRFLSKALSLNFEEQQGYSNLCHLCNLWITLNQLASGGPVVGRPANWIEDDAEK